MLVESVVLYENRGDIGLEIDSIGGKVEVDFEDNCVRLFDNRNFIAEWYNLAKFQNTEFRY